MNKNLCIIPARGGSKRIPRKNIKDFLGKPIIAYSIEAALNCGLFDEIMVSTDDVEIAEIAQGFGAKVPFLRSRENANDFATTVDVLLEVIKRYEDTGRLFEFGCCIYPTAPFVTPELLAKGLEILNKNNYDSVFPVMPFSFPIQRALRFKNDGKVEMFYPEFLMTRSQDLTPAFHDCGQFYWMNISILKQKKKLWTENTGGIVLTEMQAHDIDNEVDWSVAEFKYKLALDKKS